MAGPLIADRYHLIRPLAQGGQAEVHLARDSVSGDLVAAKRVLRAADQEALRLEFALLTTLRHPNVVRALDLVHERADLWLVQQYAPGEDLLVWGQKRRDDIAALARGVAAAIRGLQYAHAQGVVHGDVKPNNLQVDAEPIGRLPGVRLLDFGLARRVDDDSAPGEGLPPHPDGSVAGTLAYAAPEVLAGHLPTPASDYYALGAVVFEILFGHVPNPGLDPTMQHVEIPEVADAPALGDLLGDWLSPQPTRRPNATQLTRALSHVAGEALQVSIPELQSEYFPEPPMISRDVLATARRVLIDVVNNTRGAVLAIEGAGQANMAAGVRWQARLCGLHVLRAAEKLQELGQPQDASATATRLVDELLDSAKTQPILIDMAGWPADDPIGRETVSQLRAVLESNQAQRYALLCDGPLGQEQSPGSSRPNPVTCLGRDRLESEQIAELARTMLCHHQDELPWLGELAQRCAGDPDWAVALIEAQVEAGLPDALVPAGNQASLASERANALDTDPRRLLSIIALAVRPTPLPVLRRALDAGKAPELLDHLDRLCMRGLVVNAADGLWPMTPSMAIEAPRSMAEAERRQWHAHLARAWQQNAQPDARAIQRHRLRAGELDDARLLDSPALTPEDLSWAVEQLDPQQEGWLLLQERLARTEAARGNAKAALVRAREAGRIDATRGALLRTELHIDAGHPKDAMEALADQNQVGRRFQLARARAAFLLGDHALALQAAAEGRASAGHDDMRLRLQLANIEGLAAAYSGDPDGAVQLLTNAVHDAETDADPSLHARLLHSQAIAHQQLGDFDAARSAYLDCLDAAARAGDLHIAASTAQNLGTLAHRQGELGAAFAHYARAAGLCARAGSVATRASALANQGNLLLLFGDLQQAQLTLEQAAALARNSGAKALEGHVRLYQAELALLRGDLDSAADQLDRANELLADLDRTGADAADLVACDLFLARGEIEQAAKLVERLLARIAWDDPDRWRVHLVNGKTALETGTNLQRARQQLDLCLALGAERGTDERAWECHALLARCHVRLDRPKEAAFHAGHCTEAVTQLRKRIPAEQRQAFDARPDIQRASRQIAQIEVSPASASDQPSSADLFRLLEINKQLNRRLPLDALLEAILDNAIDLTGAERGFVLLRDTQRLRVRASRNVDREEVRRGMSKFSHSIAEQAVEQRSVIVAADAMADQRFTEHLSVHGLKLRAVLCVPLVANDDVKGALYVDNRFRAGAFTVVHKALMEAFADQAGIALYNAGLLSDSAQHREALAEAKDELEVLNRQLQTQVIEQAEQLSQISERLRGHEGELVRRFNAANLIGQSKVMRELFANIERLADEDAPVFICGESGSGKELVARAMHYSSASRDEPFVSVNCAAIPASLLESELFGHVKGAFTGALRDRTGLFEAAGRGVLLLDEAGDMPPAMQAKLLRVLQERTFRPVGSWQERQSRCRVLSAGQRPLEDLVAEGSFREDLLYRLRVLEVRVPPLRERPEDIPVLIAHFLRKSEQTVEISPGAMRALMDFAWPGNVRQLENELKRAVLLSEDRVEVKALSPALRPSGSRQVRPAAQGLQAALGDHERQLIVHTLEQCGGNVSEAAKQLRVHRVALYRRMRTLGIPGRRSGRFDKTRPIPSHRKP